MRAAKTISRDELAAGVITVTPDAVLFAGNYQQAEGDQSAAGWRGNYSDLWFYAYDQRTSQSTLVPVQSDADMQRLLAALPVADIAKYTQRMSRQLKTRLERSVYNQL